jgi:hypothetical protein
MEPARFTYFIAHAGADEARALALHALLAPSLPVFLDTVNLRPGDDWDRQLPLHQRQSRATVALVSAAVESAYYLREEIASAIAYHRRDPTEHRLIPVYLDGVPKDPAAIPYGLRALDHLDAAVLGLPGVAERLVQLAGALADAPPPPLPAATPPPADRFALYDALCKLMPVMFDEVVFRLQAPRQHLSPPSEPLSRRALDLVQWVELGGGQGLDGLAGAIRRVAPAVLRA